MGKGGGGGEKTMKCKTKAEKIKEFRAVLHECLESGNCTVIDRGLSTCKERDNRYCDMSYCPRLSKDSRTLLPYLDLNKWG